MGRRERGEHHTHGGGTSQSRLHFVVLPGRRGSQARFSVLAAMLGGGHVEEGREAEGLAETGSALRQCEERDGPCREEEEEEVQEEMCGYSFVPLKVEIFFYLASSA